MGFFQFQVCFKVLPREIQVRCHSLAAWVTTWACQLLSTFTEDVKATSVTLCVLVSLCRNMERFVLTGGGFVILSHVYL